MDEMYCTNCGAIIKRQDEYCVNCGVRVSQLTSTNSNIMFSDRSRLVAGLLGIFLGPLGIHRFYLGNIVVGIVQIIVTLITGIGGLWGFIEGIIIIAGTNWSDAQGRPLRKYNEQSAFSQTHSSI